MKVALYIDARACMCVYMYVCKYMRVYVGIYREWVASDAKGVVKPNLNHG